MNFEVWIRDRALELTEIDAAEVTEMIERQLFKYFMSEDFTVEKS